MNNKLIIGFIILCIMSGLYFLNLNNQKNYSSSTTELTTIEQDEIKKILIQAQGEAIELIRIDTTWSITGHDTLTIKKQPLISFFDKVLNLKLETVMTKKEEKWGTFNIDDSSGTHLALVDFNDNTISYFVFGRSNSDYARCYVRRNTSSDVYLASENVMFNFQTRPEYWGEKISETIEGPPVE